MPVNQPLYSSRARILNKIRAQARIIATLYDDKAVPAASLPTVLHFRPPEYSHTISAVYPISKSMSCEENDDRLGQFMIEKVLISHSVLTERVRSTYHQQLPMLSLDRPVLRLGNALTLGADGALPASTLSSKSPKSVVTVDNILTDVHLQLGTVSRTKGKLSLVKGSYLYYHYNQVKYVQLRALIITYNSLGNR